MRNLSISLYRYSFRMLIKLWLFHELFSATSNPWVFFLFVFLFFFEMSCNCTEGPVHLWALASPCVVFVLNLHQHLAILVLGCPF